MILDSTTTMIGVIAAIACIVVSIILLTASEEYLKKSAFFNGGKHRKGAALMVYRFTGAQMLVMGIVMLLVLFALWMSIGWIVAPGLIILIFLPIACTMYMKRSKRFNPHLKKKQ